jgi:hypothetical protein
MGTDSARCFVDDGLSGLVQYADSSFCGNGQNGLLRSLTVFIPLCQRQVAVQSAD